ncbi:Alginate lyase [Tsuneonella dongtanensis]|uniref:Alginate lyase n=1 Tax=Tsuneonella dongtanensis TaxID=692370 RepID=A0A1B2ADI4_9SPHN|nr:alginate lyase family protein [Tsuneonella dongtanensis]ANY20220.1 Alginate lyase [Tsuneonella dongtanensis]
MPAGLSLLNIALRVLAALSITACAAPAAAQVCDGSNGYEAAAGGARTFLWTPGMLASAKATAASDPAVLARLKNDADAALGRGPYSVTHKTKLAASGDRHDYQSIGPYWWPTAGKPGGLPYSRRDGRINPERSGPQFDLDRLQNFSNDVSLLALAWHHTGDRRYAEHAAALVRVWFVDPATRMNPNFDHAQAVPGRSLGRAEGVMDAFRFVQVVEAIGLLGPSGALSDGDGEAVEAWFGDLVQWMATSPIGRAERAKTNNHGVYYDMLIGQFALYARLEPVAKTIAERFGPARIEPQFAADGTLPEELSRTRSWHYTLWTLHAAARMAQIGACIGVDVAGYRNGAGAGLRTALDRTAAVVDPEKDWGYPDIAFGDAKAMREEAELAVETFRTAAWYLADRRYEAAAMRYEESAGKSPAAYYLGPHRP